MKIALTTTGDSLDSKIDPRFGRTSYILVQNTETKELIAFDNKAIEQEAHGAGPKTSQKLFELGANVLITGNGPGGNAASVLKNAGVSIFVGAENMTANEALEAYFKNKLTKFKL